MSDLKRVKIEHDGGVPYSAKVMDAETGEMIPNVYRVEISLDANASVSEVKLYSYLPIVAVTADASIHTICPQCGQEVSQQIRKALEVKSSDLGDIADHR